MKHIWILILSLIIFSCSRPSETGFESLKWDKVDPETDSITFLLENEFYNVAPYDSISHIIDGLYPIPQERETPVGKEKATRWHYWKGRLLKSTASGDSAKWHLRKAMETVDSNAFHYTYRRIRTMLNSSEKGIAEGYLRRLLGDLNYYSGIKDMVMDASVSILIANTLNDSYQHDYAIEYFKRADSIHRLLGLTKYVVKNQINVAACLNSMGDTEKSAEIMRRLRDDSITMTDFFTYNTVLRNSYIYTKDISFLRQAYDRMMRHDSTLTINAVLEYLLNRHYIADKENPDTTLADYYVSKAFSRLPLESNPEIRAAIYLAKSEQMERLGNNDSAYLCLKRHLEETEKFNTYRQPAEVAKIHNTEVMAKYKYEQEQTHHFYMVRILILVIFVVATAGIAAFIILRIKERHKIEEQRLQMEKMRSELDIERYQKQSLAIFLSMEDTDRNLSEIKEKISRLNTEGKVSSEEMQRIESVIKSHIANRDDLKKFIELFEKAHPHFISNLKKHYPDLSESQTKLAVYVYTGMSNKQIATYLNIRLESVKQARWRLRVKMGLKADEALEDTLHNLANSRDEEPAS